MSGASDQLLKVIPSWLIFPFVPPAFQTNFHTFLGLVINFVFIIIPSRLSWFSLQNWLVGTWDNRDERHATDDYFQVM